MVLPFTVLLAPRNTEDLERLARSVSLLRPGAEVEDRTAGAVGPLGFADGPTVKDEEVGDEGPLVPGNDPAELLLDFVLFVALGEA